MKSLFKGIMDKFSGSALSTALSGRLYNTVAKQGAAKPYCVFTLVSGVPDGQMSEDAENCLFQFSIFDSSESVAPICDLYDKLTDLFDDCQLTVTGYTHIFMQRELQQLERDPEDPGVWQYIVEYRILIEKA